MTAQRRVLRWSVPVDDKPHPIGTGPVVLTECRPDGYAGHTVEVWTEEVIPPDWPHVDVAHRQVQVFGTGHPIPQGATHVGSTLDGTRLVWHVYAL